MNQHTSNSPHDDRDDSSRAEPGEDRGNFRVVRSEVAQVQPLTARLADTVDETPIRAGSPFATDPIAALPAKTTEPLLDVGPMRYTAMGAVAASVMVLGFAGTAAWWFPAGGALIAALGCVLSIFGLYSTYRKTSAGLLAIHLCLFVVSYGRSLG